MSARDRSWTVAPALLWFVGCLVVALLVLDGGVQVLADRFTARRDAEAAPVGPAFAPRPIVVADTRGEEAAPAAATPASRQKVLALEDACIDGAVESCKRWGMDGFYRAMHDAKQKKLGRALRVSWYGDSVIATDAIPARFRTLLQTELGDGGPGFLHIVPPHRFCANETTTRTTTGSWITHAISTTQIPDGLYGVGESTAETADGRATLKLNAGSASLVELYYLAQPRGGTVAITADGKPVVKVSTRGTAKKAAYATAKIDGGAKSFGLAASGKVRLFGIGLENATGAVVDNFGVVSANVKSFAVNNPEHFEGELAHRGADLVMVMIGANEAAWLGPSDRDTKDYAANYEKFLAEIRHARPEASCLVVSPTDQAEVKSGSYESRPVMPALIRAQREAALHAGCAFYSTYEWMGGSGSAAKWVRKGFLSTDFQHVSHKGAERLSDGLYRTLIAAYSGYAAH